MTTTQERQSRINKPLNRESSCPNEIKKAELKRESWNRESSCPNEIKKAELKRESWAFDSLSVLLDSIA
jgi:hypothetical protein